MFHVDGKEDLPDNFGNFEHVRQKVENQEFTDYFSFAVVGDPRGLDTFEDICDELRDEPLSFMVILGDFVREGTFSADS